MRKHILVSLFLLLLGMTTSVFAQSDSDLARLELSIWPEYDRRAVLVIYRAQLSGEVALPATVRLPIPVGVGEPHAVAYAGATGELINAPFERSLDGEWATITLETESSTIWLEYYTDLTIVDQERSFQVEWPEGWPAGEVAYEVQQPLGAAELTIAPAPVAERTGPDSLTYYTGSLAQAAVGEGGTISVGYNRSLDTLTVDLLTANSAAAAPARASPEWLVPAAIGLGLVAIAAGAAVLWRGRRPRGRRALRQETKPSPRPKNQVFCHNCGQRAQNGDRFCRNCGTELRQP
jgi:hypothetical protein